MDKAQGLDESQVFCDLILVVMYENNSVGDRAM